MTERYVLGLDVLDKTQVALAGGKGANLGELTRIDGIEVPAGFCVTTDAYWQAIGAAGIPSDVAAAVTGAVEQFGGGRTTWAVRSSATAEDLPGASFAGQHDSYLNVAGAQVLEHVRRCWASLLTDRAVAYRQHSGFGDRKVAMAVVVQRMVAADAAGVAFTADPVTSDRKVVCIEAIAGLGEALVSGLVNADSYKVRDGAIAARTAVAPTPILTDAQITRLAALARRIEAHFGCPQDVEWCLAEDDFQIVQSRPITTLFPVPTNGDGDGENRVYISVGHQQMMTDAMKPLGLSFWQLTTPRPMAQAGGRLFADATPMLASPSSRASFLNVVGRSDPLIGDALQTILDRGDFIADRPDEGPRAWPFDTVPSPVETDPAIVTGLIERREASIAELKRDIATKSGPELLDFILEDLTELRRLLFDPASNQVLKAAMESAWWLNDQLQAWLGEKNVVDALTQSLPDNVTSQMGLALLDVADVIRPHADVVAFLRQAGDSFLGELPAIPGGTEAQDAIEGYLARYGMRCVGEIDITKPRWSERPGTLVPLILGNIANFEPGESQRRFEQGRKDAQEKERQLLTRLLALPDGEPKAAETKRMIDRVRTFSGYREYPKYHMISRYFSYKQALLLETERLVQAGVLRAKEDIFFLTFAELQDVVRTRHVDDQLISRRKDEFRSVEALTPPRVLTSDGEAVAGRYRREGVPAGALAGLAVSAGTVEGRARVVLDLAKADFEAGDILVTAYTDPSWTPAFVAIAGLVTEVGGQMTHGAVIAREYGLPAVVGVEHATRLISDGQRIRVNGTDGYIEILS